MADQDSPPILADKHYDSHSAFTPENLLRDARRQKSTSLQRVPDICLLDPDGDIVRRLQADGRARRHDGWVCYHTDLHVFEAVGMTMGVVGCVVGSSFAVLVAEELFASGCKILLSMTSSGQLVPVRTPPYFILIDRALRDEGTSYHYLPPTTFSAAPEGLIDTLAGAFDDLDIGVLRGGDVDDRCAVPGNRGGDRVDDPTRPACRRNGSRGAICLRQGPVQARDLLRACHQPDGAGRRRFRKRSRRRHHRCPTSPGHRGPAPDRKIEARRL